MRMCTADILGDCDCDGNQLDALGECGGDVRTPMPMAFVTTQTMRGRTRRVWRVQRPEIYECGCADIPEGDCDCDGNQLDALGECGGDCAEDADADGICDDVDDALENSTHVASVTERSTSADVRTSLKGDCDCDGNQLDALGECGGPCEADADADGICDDVDPCVGELDACGICNGPGEIYECGCADIPEGTATAANQLDALGVCGSDCAEDADADAL